MMDLDQFLQRVRNNPEHAAEFSTILTEINEDKLQQELKEFAAMYSWWATKYSQARSRAQKLEERYENLKAQAFLECDSDKTVTERKRIAQTQPEVQDALEDFLSAEADRRLLKTMVDALSHKRAMLQQLSAQKRTEAQSY